MRRIAEGFHFSGGEKVIHQSQENKGLSGSWREAWTWRDRELFVILEDDVEVSAHWYRAAVNMWQVPVNISQYQSISVNDSQYQSVGQSWSVCLLQKYGGREYVGGVGLQNQEFSFAPPYEGNNFTEIVRFVAASNN